MQVVARQEDDLDARKLLVFFITIDFDALSLTFIKTVHASIGVILDLFELVLHAFGWLIKFAPIFVRALVQVQNLLKLLAVYFVEMARQKFYIPWIILNFFVNIAFDRKGHVKADSV